MKWIVLAILVCIVPYTIIRIIYRKPGHAAEPYADMKDRANTARLLSAGFQRITLPAEFPADPLENPVTATIAPAPGGLPAELKSTIIDLPTLPDEITRVSAPPEAAAHKPYAFRFACTLPDPKQQLARAELYVKGREVVITPDYESLAGQLTARSRDAIVQLTVPPGVLKPGRYDVTLIGRTVSRAWKLEVK